MAWMISSSEAKSPLCLVSFVAVAEDSKQQNAFSISAQDMLGHDMSKGIHKSTCLIIQSLLELMKDYKKAPNG
jgi:hypothetical protein